jgi:signal transduction histidine kinase
LALVKLDYREEGVLNIEDTDLSELVSSIVKRINPLASKKNIGLFFENNKDVTIEADSVKLTLALSNLIENAVKYTPDGGTVTVTVDADHQNAYFTDGGSLDPSASVPGKTSGFRQYVLFPPHPFG